MLRNFLLTKWFKKFIKSGFYLDFLIKNIFQSIIKGYFIKTYQFFGEKYVLEYFFRYNWFNELFFYNNIKISQKFNLLYLLNSFSVLIFLII